ncbi:putative ferric-chelate reductase 1 [Glandiceps talaboti]
MSTLWIFVAVLLFHGIVADQSPDSSDPPPKHVTSEGCGVSKGCYVIPKGCTDAYDCFVMLTWKEADNSSSLTTFELSGKLNGHQEYVSLAFSFDERMSDDDAYSCIYHKGIVQFEHTYHDYIHPIPADMPNGTIEHYMVYAESTIQCSFTIPKVVNIEQLGLTFDLDDDLYIFIGHGSVANPEAAVPRKGKHHVLPIISASKIDFNSVDTDSSVAKRPIFVKLHACLFLFAWFGCASIAIVLARFYKIMWPNTKPFGKPVWLVVHLTLMVLNVLCSCVGFVLIFIFLNGFVPYKYLIQPKVIHAISGIVVTAFAVINVFMGLFRPAPGSSGRPYFDWFHWVFGFSSFILALACIFTGFGLEILYLPSYATWVMVGFVCFHISAEAVLKFLQGLRETSVKRVRAEQYELDNVKGDNGVLVTDQSTSGDEKPKLGTGSCVEIIAKIVIVTYVLVVVAMLSTFIITIALM